MNTTKHCHLSAKATKQQEHMLAIKHLSFPNQAEKTKHHFQWLHLGAHLKTTIKA